MAIRDILSHPFVYLLYQDIVGGRRARRRLYEDHISHLTGMNVLDIGCGLGYALEYFDRPNYWGYDISEQYIAWANKRYGNRATFLAKEFDQAAAAELPKMDVVMLMGLVHHLDDAETEKLFRTIKSVLKPEGVMVTLDGCYVPGQSPIAKWFLDGDRGQHIRNEPSYRQLAQRVFPNVKCFIEEDYFRIPYTLAVLECSGAG